jgi:ATP-binding cassette subfamily F protein 3
VILSVVNLKKSFADTVILDGVDLRIEAREKVALVGRNGSGKTTLLKILTGDLEPDAGSVNWLRGSSVGYLSQHQSLTSGRTVIEEAESARANMVEIQRRLEALSKAIENNPSPEDLEEFALLQEHFIDGGGYSIETDFRVVLQRMGFDESEFSKDVGALSGGEKTRLALAKLLLREPDLLILDEPTNHLDLEATEWLESWIRGYHGAVMLVSHDRVFVQNVCDRVVELRDGKTKSYPGSFETYLRLRAEDFARQEAAAKKQQQQIAKLDEYVRRFMNSQRTAQARGRQKQMVKLQASAIHAPKADKGIAAGFKAAKRSGDLVAKCEDLSMRFGEQKLFQHLDWQVRLGERWGVVGANGVGKSTLLKLLLKKIEPSAGQCQLGANVAPGYFSQDADTLDPKQTPMHTLHYDLDMDLGSARNLLGRFLISGDDATRPIGTLSGGERNKMQLAVLTQLGPNTLLLDEPTNHLDMESREALADVLKSFQGTLILVSHDRWLLDQVTDNTLDIRQSGYQTDPGSFGEYRRRQRVSASTPTPEPVAAQTDRAVTLSPRELSKEIARLQKEVVASEQNVSTLESELNEIERKMANPSTADDITSLSHRYGELIEQIAAAMQAWESLTLNLEELVAQRDQ